MRSVIIAVIDDESLQYLTFKLMVSKILSNVNVLHFADGQEALDYVTGYSADPEFLPDYIFLDLKMPRMTGWAFLDLFYDIMDTLKKKTSVYVLSSSIDYRDRERALNHPAVKDYLVKPLAMADIHTILNPA